MCDSRTNLSKLLTEQVKEMYQGKIKVFQNKIPKTVKVGEAIYSGQSIKKYAKRKQCRPCIRPFGKGDLL